MVLPDVWGLQRHQKRMAYVRPSHKKGTQSIKWTANIWFRLMPPSTEVVGSELARCLFFWANCGSKTGQNPVTFEQITTYRAAHRSAFLGLGHLCFVRFSNVYVIVYRTLHAPHVKHRAPSLLWCWLHLFFSEITLWAGFTTPRLFCVEKKRMSTVGSDVKRPQMSHKKLLFQFTYQLKDTEAAPAAIIW